jgi:hypothetical protein
MVNLYSVLNLHVDRNLKSKSGYKDAERMDACQSKKVLKYLTDYLKELEKVTPPAPEKQFYQLLAKIKD